MRGSILVNYDETPNSRGTNRFDLFVNNRNRDLQFTNVNNYYSTFMFVGDVVRFTSFILSGQFPNFTLYREDYTTDDEGGDNGIKKTLIPFSILPSPNLIVQFTGSTVSNAYNFKYIIDCSIGPLPTFYTWSLGYDASNATDACIDYATSPSTYYTTVPTLQNGIYLYDSNTVFDLSAAGYYSDGTNVWYKSDTTLPLTNESACVIPTPTPTPTVTPTPTLTPTPTATPTATPTPTIVYEFWTSESYLCSIAPTPSCSLLGPGPIIRILPGQNGFFIFSNRPHVRGAITIDPGPGNYVDISTGFVFYATCSVACQNV
jgi:hypothetical protein